MSTRFRALQHRNFQLFFAGQLVSLIGTWMQSTAQLWLVYKLTNSAALLGVFGFANQVPILLLASIGGYVGDRYNRHRGVIVTQTASMILAFILAVLTLTGVVSRMAVRGAWLIIFIAFLVGIVTGTYSSVYIASPVVLWLSGVSAAPVKEAPQNVRGMQPAG